jgi:hypothetical protein
VRSEEQRLSVRTSFRQTLSALSQSRRATNASAYFDTLTDVRARTDASPSAGGGLADGTLYEAELAHCSSCEPQREARHEVELEALRLQAPQGLPRGGAAGPRARAPARPGGRGRSGRPRGGHVAAE